MFVCSDSDKCETCSGVLERLETIDDDTDKHNIQFVKTNDVKRKFCFMFLCSEIRVFEYQN